MFFRPSLILLCLAGCATTAPPLADPAMNLLAGEWDCEFSDSRRTEQAVLIAVNFSWTENLESDGQFRFKGKGDIINVHNDGNFELGKFQMAGYGEWSATSNNFSQQHSSVSFDALDENRLSKLMETGKFNNAFPVNSETTYRIDSNEWIRTGTRTDVECQNIKKTGK